MNVNKKRQPMTFDETFKYHQYSNGYMYLKEGGESDANSDTFNFIQTNKQKFLDTLGSIAQKNFEKQQMKMNNGGINLADWSMEDPNRYLKQMTQFALESRPGKHSYIEEINQYNPDGTLKKNWYKANDKSRDDDTLYSLGEVFSQYINGTNISDYQNVTNPQFKFQYGSQNNYRRTGNQYGAPLMNDYESELEYQKNKKKQMNSYYDAEARYAEELKQLKKSYEDAQRDYETKLANEEIYDDGTPRPPQMRTPSTSSTQSSQTPGAVKTATKSATTKQTDDKIPGGIRQGVKPGGAQTSDFTGTTTDELLSYLDQYGLKDGMKRPVRSSQTLQQPSSPTTPGGVYGVTKYTRDRNRQGLFKRNNSHIFEFGYLDPLQMAQMQAQNNNSQNSQLTQKGDLWKRPDYLLPNDYGTGARLQEPQAPMQGPLLLPGQENNVGNIQKANTLVTNTDPNNVAKPDLTEEKPQQTQIDRRRNPIDKSNPNWRHNVPADGVWRGADRKKLQEQIQKAGLNINDYRHGRYSDGSSFYMSNDEFKNLFVGSNRELLKKQIESRGLNPNDFELYDLGNGQVQYRPRMAKGGEYEYGGTNPYIEFYMKQGGEYYLSESDIEYIKKMGGQIEYLD